MTLTLSDSPGLVLGGGLGLGGDDGSSEGEGSPSRQSPSPVPHGVGGGGLSFNFGRPQSPGPIFAVRQPTSSAANPSSIKRPTALATARPLIRNETPASQQTPGRLIAPKPADAGVRSTAAAALPPSNAARPLAAPTLASKSQQMPPPPTPHSRLLETPPAEEAADAASDPAMIEQGGPIASVEAIQEPIPNLESHLPPTPVAAEKSSGRQSPEVTEAEAEPPAHAELELPMEAAQDEPPIDAIEAGSEQPEQQAVEAESEQPEQQAVEAVSEQPEQQHLLPAAQPAARPASPGIEEIETPAVAAEAAASTRLTLPAPRAAASGTPARLGTGLLGSRTPSSATPAAQPGLAASKLRAASGGGGAGSSGNGQNRLLSNTQSTRLTLRTPSTPAAAKTPQTSWLRVQTSQSSSGLRTLSGLGSSTPARLATRPAATAAPAAAAPRSLSGVPSRAQLGAPRLGSSGLGSSAGSGGLGSGLGSGLGGGLGGSCSGEVGPMRQRGAQPRPAPYVPSRELRTSLGSSLSAVAAPPAPRRLSSAASGLQLTARPEQLGSTSASTPTSSPACSSASSSVSTFGSSGSSRSPSKIIEHASQAPELNRIKADLHARKVGFARMAHDAMLYAWDPELELNLQLLIKQVNALKEAEKEIDLMDAEMEVDHSDDDGDGDGGKDRAAATPSSATDSHVATSSPGSPDFEASRLASSSIEGN